MIPSSDTPKQIADLDDAERGYKNKMYVDCERIPDPHGITEIFKDEARSWLPVT